MHLLALLFVFAVVLFAAIWWWWVVIIAIFKQIGQIYGHLVVGGGHHWHYGRFGRFWPIWGGFDFIGKMVTVVEKWWIYWGSCS